jgi:4-hydroxymandelate synthase
MERVVAAHDVEHVEIFTSDQRKTSDYFISMFGFQQQAEGVKEGLNSALLAQGQLRIVVSSGPAADAFLQAHGDGIRDIAFSCDDAAAVRDRAVAAGASTLPGTTDPVVSGFGNVQHTLVQRAAGEERRLPAGWTWTASDSAPIDDGTPELRLLDHIAVCLEAGSLHDTVRFYIDGFGLEQYYSEYVSVGEQAMDSIVVRSPSAGITFTIIEPDPTKQAGQIDEFLERNGGGGVQHLAFLVDEIIPAVLAFEARGVEFLQTPGTYYDALVERISGLDEAIADLRKANVLADCDEWGYLLQLFTRSPFERRTLFFELIQRQGAQGFGSSNIRALYEAVERAREIAT